ncbi:MAG: thiamine protein [Chlorobi bacterium]|nr:thiamine protein [Chlorobiota bacterium]
MATNVHIPTPLRSCTDNRARVEVEGNTVGETLERLVTEHPALRGHLFDGEGKIRSFINIYLNDDDIRYLAGEETTVGATDTISIIPAIAGGATR